MLYLYVIFFIFLSVFFFLFVRRIVFLGSIILNSVRVIKILFGFMIIIFLKGVFFIGFNMLIGIELIFNFFSLNVSLIFLIMFLFIEIILLL